VNIVNSSILVSSRMEEGTDSKDSWYVEWAWVGGYSSISTIIFIFNILILFSVGKNRFLHYSFHYVIIALSLRNMLRVFFTLFLVFLAKLVKTPWLLRTILFMPENSNNTMTDPSNSKGMSITCEVLSMSDHILMSSLMFYLAALSLYMFCRRPNPPLGDPSQANYRDGRVLPVQERCWVPPLLLLIPPLLSVFLSLPVPLLHMTHPMLALPGGLVCTNHEIQQFNTYQSSVAILGFLLPASIVFCLLIGLSIRRCISCSAGACVSSFCKEEMCLAFLAVPYTLAYLIMDLPLLDHYLDKLALPQTGLQYWITPEIGRAVDMVLGLLLPLVVFTFIPGYRQFSPSADPSDLRRVSRVPRDSYNHIASAPDETISQSSLDLELVTRNHYMK